MATAHPGEAILLTGTLGDHGIAVMSQREGLHLETPVRSDVTALTGLITGLHQDVPRCRVLRDPTRGGLAAALCDIAEASRTALVIEEKALPISEPVQGVCELLGLDPLAVANEGKAIVVCPGPEAAFALAALRQHPLGRHAVQIGTVAPDPVGSVLLNTRLGGQRLITRPSGELLPRIC